MMSTVLQDLRHGARLLLRAPGFTLVAVAALAIGIGANTAIFSVVNTLILRPLPYPDAERLAVIWEHNLPRDKRDNVVSPGNFIHWREMQFVDLAAVSGTVGSSFKVTVTGSGEPEEVPMQMVSASFFPLLGVQPSLGRPFTEEEDKPESRVVVLSDRLWRRRYGGDRDILEKSITVQGIAHSVVGVMPPGFSFIDKTVDLWFPIGFNAEARTPRGRWLSVVGRLKTGVTFEQAQQDMSHVHAELTQQFPAFNTGWTARVVPLKEQLTGNLRPALLVLLGSVAVVLLIACANVANLLLARATARQRELAVRAALGAARGRLIRQLLAESAVLAVVGGAGGLLLAWVGVRAMRLALADRLPIQRLEAVGIDGWVLAFTAAASLLSGIVFGLIPALTTSGAGLSEMLKEGGRTGSGSRGKRARNAFVVAQIALALVLLAGAGLLIRSFIRLVNVNPGFNAQGTVTLTVSLPRTRYGQPQQRVQFYRTLFDRIDALAGVQASGAVSFLPLTGLGAATSFEVVGQPKAAPGEEPVADVRVVTNDYFKAMGIPLIRGRLFHEGDAADESSRVIINQTLAEKYWPGEDPIGKRVRISWNDTRDDEVIGVVADVRHAGLDTVPRAMTYWPHARFSYPGMAIVVRTSTSPSAIVNSVVAIVREQDPELAVSNVRTMQDVVSESVGERRLTMILLAVFAVAALVIAAVGIYGVIAYSVTQRTQEIGIRMALGAQRRDVLRMVVGQALLLALAGIALGSAGALLVTRLMAGLLFEVRPQDPMTLVAVAAVLGIVAVAASYVPGRRATRVDPVVALRAE
jgi:putative ABC transport system permease protein